MVSCCPQRPIATGDSRSTKDLFNKEWESVKKIKDVRGELSKYDRFVPVIGKNENFLKTRQELFNLGIYPGVEYRILDILLFNGNSPISLSTLRNNTLQGENKKDLSSFSNIRQANITLLVRPAYPLIPQLERPWPVSIELQRIPYVLTRGAYNMVTVLGSGSIALTFFFTAFILSQFVTFSCVNSKSMMPTIQPKDVILVEKITPALKKVAGFQFPSNSIVFFTPPPLFTSYLENNQLPPIPSKDLIVKRIKSTPQVTESPVCLSVLGDNAPASLDSRYWGCLPVDNIVGSPLLRIYPFNRFGFLKSVP